MRIYLSHSNKSDVFVVYARIVKSGSFYGLRSLEIKARESPADAPCGRTRGTRERRRGIRLRPGTYCLRSTRMTCTTSCADRKIHNAVLNHMCRRYLVRKCMYDIYRSYLLTPPPYTCLTAVYEYIRTPTA